VRRNWWSRSNRAPRLLSSVTQECRWCLIPVIAWCRCACAIAFGRARARTSALLAALGASGLPNEEFLFAGFLPQRRGERRRALDRLRIEDRTIIIYEAPHRIAEAVADAREILGDRQACLAREVTKLHEEFRRGRLSEIAVSLEERPARGEITLLIALRNPRTEQLVESSQSLADRVEELMRQAKLDARKL